MLYITRKLHKKQAHLMVIGCVVLPTAIIYMFYLQKGHKHASEIFTSFQDHPPGDEYYKHGRWRNLSKQQIAKFSELGKILFLEKEYPKINTSAKNYTILVWKYGPAFHSRYINHFSNRRMDSDIPVPYGRTIPLTKEEKSKKFNFEEWNKSKRQDVLLVNVNTNCRANNYRWVYLKKLWKYITIHRYGGGKCGQYKCPGYVFRDCSAVSRYKFYLAFENSNCNEYITEKLWWNSFEKEAVPIIMGTTPEILNQILPPRSYIHVNDYVNPQDLAKYIIHLNNTPSELERYLEWRNHFKIVNEHGFFQSKCPHYCRVCEALNYNSKKKKVYNNLNEFWLKNQCQRGWSSIFGVNMVF